MVAKYDVGGLLRGWPPRPPRGPQSSCASIPVRIPLAATVIESLSKARALRTKPCQRAAEGPSSTAWTRPQILARGPKALNRLLLPAPATKQEPPTKGTAPELDKTAL